LIHMRAVIIGAGIGGLTTALALHQRGIECTVYESVREMAPLGVGINVLPHAIAELQHLGVADRIVSLGVQTGELAFFNRHGQLIWREPRGLAAGNPVPQVSVHRGRFQMELFAATVERLGSAAVQLAMAVESVVPGDANEPPTVMLRNRTTGATVTDTADVVIAADGIHSAVRRQFVPDEGPPKWSGNILWRATTRTAGFLTGRSMFMAGHLQHKFVAYPITEPDPTDGTQVINWIAELDRSATGMPGIDDWNRQGDVSDFGPRFDDWKFDWLDIPALISGADAVYEFPMVDRDPLPSWRQGRVTLLGDAAHPMYPIGSNGSSQAILDARAIADQLAIAGEAGGSGAEIVRALNTYEETRRPATAQIVMSNRQHGPERVLDLAEQRAPDGFADVNDVFAPGELEEVATAYKRAAGFDRDAVTRRAATTPS
jgi:5-methylphenazine-1-carboxylate 1-monooxygenase